MDNQDGARLYRYLMVGATATALQFILLHFAVLAGVRPLWGSVLGYVLSAIFNYWANRKWTFEYDGAHMEAVIKFTLVVALGLLANSAVFLLAMGRMHYLLAQLFATAAAVAVNYLGNAYWTFRTEAREGRHA